jgi:hypothetical protein
MAKKKFPLKYTNVLLHCCWSKIGTVFSKKTFFLKNNWYGFNANSRANLNGYFIYN